MSGSDKTAPYEETGRFFRIIFLVVVLLLFAGALLSYTPSDAVILYGGAPGTVSNWIGWIGAFAAHVLFMHLGLATYLLLFLFLFRSVRLGLGEFHPDCRQFALWQGFFASLIIIAGALLLFGLTPETFEETLPSLGLGHKDAIKSGISGGVIGQFFAAPRHGELEEGILRHLIGAVGCAIVGFAFVAGGLVWLYIAEWKKLIAACFAPAADLDDEAEEDDDSRPFSAANRRLSSAPAPAPVRRAPAPEPKPAEFTVETREETPLFSAPVEKAAPAPASVAEEDYEDEEENLQDQAGEEEEPFEETEEPSPAPVPVEKPAPAPAPAPAPVPAPAPAMRSNDLQTGITREGKDSTPALFQSEYVLPPITMLSQGNDSCGEDVEEISAAKRALEQTLEDFGIRGWVSNHTSGPRVTRFEVTLEPGVNVRKVEQIADNIAMNLAAQSVRILAPIPGRPVVGVEISNSKASAVFMRSVMESPEWRSGKAEIPIALGKDVSGKPVVLDIASAPHMLIAGSTGTGKSVCSNSLIMSLLFRFRPDELKLIMVDPKVVEFDVYKNLPHLLTPVINDSTKVPVALRWAVNEMEKRYRTLAAARVKKISEFNARPLNSEPVFDEDGVQIPDRLPVLLVIIDELGDLMMTEAKKDVENSITRIAQKGRAAGVHVVVATQRPSTNVITGVIKANLPTRLCFQVRSLIDSRVVLDAPGGEKLLGKGDMLYMSPTSMHIERVQGSFVPDNDIQKVVDFVSAQAPQHFDSQVLAEEGEESEEEQGGFANDDDDAPWDNGQADISALVKKYMRPGDSDTMRQALEVVILDRKASTSYLQRRLGVGYNRAAELIDQMEKRGIVGPPSGSGNKRDILVFDGLDIGE